MGKINKNCFIVGEIIGRLNVETVEKKNMMNWKGEERIPGAISLSW